ncbi:hypothetical protein [Nocardioides mangrovi]|uniref:Uncharacterized protein n=1 Tax=Nocardioides mangrovi TaxID=2874580 RepID=A0ABS7UJD6_9ACTN|nr:hypothetical protein [Nocardioides mangrovi]MBZ5741153.1 hypothetical protein [Nocardioides mangrovi]
MTAVPRLTPIQLLLLEVDEAREAVVRLRGDVEQSRRKVLAAQARLRRALETYAAFADARGLALPHRLRIELTVYRSLESWNGRHEDEAPDRDWRSRYRHEDDDPHR